MVTTKGGEMKPGIKAKRIVEKTREGTDLQEKGVYIPIGKRLPYAPENLRMSKAQFIEAQEKRKERELKHKELDAQLEKGENQKSETVPESQPTEDMPEKKKVTRDRK